MSCILLHLCIYFLTALCPKEVVRVRLSHPSFNSLANAQCWRRGEPSSSRLSSSTARLWLGYEKYENVHLRRTAHQWARLMDWVSALWLSRIYDLHWLLKSPSLAAGSVVAAGVDPQKCQVEHASPAASCNARLNDSAQIRRKNLNSAECVTQQESWVIWRHFFLSFICLWFKLILHLESLVFHSLCPQVGDSITLADISAWSLPGLPHFWRLLAESRNCIAT